MLRYYRWQQQTQSQKYLNRLLGHKRFKMFLQFLYHNENFDLTTGWKANWLCSLNLLCNNKIQAKVVQMLDYTSSLKPHLQHSQRHYSMYINTIQCQTPVQTYSCRPTYGCFPRLMLLSCQSRVRCINFWVRVTGNTGMLKCCTGKAVANPNKVSLCAISHKESMH